MLKKISIIFIVSLVVFIKNVDADSISIDEIVNDLEKSEINVSRGATIEIDDNKIIIIDNDFKTIFELIDDTLIYSSNEDKEILKESTIWIDEVIKIVLSKFNYNEDIDINSYNFNDNGIEGVKNKYIINEKEMYYYFYLKISLNNINLNNNINNDISDYVIKEDNKVDSVEKKSNNTEMSGVVFYTELFCVVIVVIMLILNSATKK